MTADPGDGPDLQHRPASMVMIDVVGYVRLMELDERNVSASQNSDFSILHLIVEERRATILNRFTL
jgi:adenylate cyclase